MLYAENLQPDEVTAILQQLNPDDKVKETSGPFESLWLTSFSPRDQQELAGLFGAKAEEFQPPTKAEDERLFKDMLIEKTTKKDAGAKKNGDAKQPPPFRYAVVLANTTRQASDLSKEVKTFLDSRQSRPGTVRLVVFLQPPSA